METRQKCIACCSRRIVSFQIVEDISIANALVRPPVSRARLKTRMSTGHARAFRPDARAAMSLDVAQVMVPPTRSPHVSRQVEGNIARLRSGLQSDWDACQTCPRYPGRRTRDAGFAGLYQPDVTIINRTGCRATRNVVCEHRDVWRQLAPANASYVEFLTWWQFCTNVRNGTASPAVADEAPKCQWHLYRTHVPSTWCGKLKRSDQDDHYGSTKVLPDWKEVRTNEGGTVDAQRRHTHRSANNTRKGYRCPAKRLRGLDAPIQDVLPSRAVMMRLHNRYTEYSEYWFM
jgi:hypothetical protein